MELFPFVSSVMSQGVAALDRDGRLVHWNRAAQELTGWSAEDPRALGVFDLDEGLADLGDGSWIDVAHRDDGKRRVTIFSDARERVALKEAIFRLSELATTDILTALPNRALGQERLAQALALARREYFHVGLLLIDLDGFRRLNDSLGHLAGDAVLRQVAQRLRECARESDTPARLGGDEFLIILASMTDAADAEIAAERVLEAFASPFVVQEKELRVTCSVGVAVFPKDGFEADDLLRNADAAMHAAKAVAGSAYRSSDLRPRLRLVPTAGPSSADTAIG
jgi:diguanylate cyclase (GGDEF)-like protein